MGSTLNGISLDQIASDGVKTGELDMAASKLKVGGVAYTGTGNDLNASAISTKINWFSDFLGDSIPSEMTGKAGSGTANAVGISDGIGGRASILTSSADAAITANASALELSGLNWRADQGGLLMEARIQCSRVSSAMIFIGFTDTTQASTLEEPIMLVAGDLDSTATDAVGVLYDVDGTTSDYWCHGGTKNGTDTVPAYHTAGPTNDVYQTIRVEVSAAGAVQGFVDGVAIGTPVANAVTATVPLLPIIFVANRDANAVTVLVDYFRVQATR